MPSTNFDVNINATGAAPLEKSAKNTADSLERAAKASTRISKPVQAVRAASEKEEITSYGVSRSAVGTGAAGRDFAQQSQGLGGLVRLYATFAANIFAASAAFSALSRAMDTTNMIKGLDQLGASSGRNLGTLAKRLVATADGAISLRDSIEAVSKSNSAGLTENQILRLGNVAKTASQALGLSMPDALSRLSRGISKIEPELLDELGIFVRVDTAVTEYARSLGKTATSLTDFQRRQAFAIAVLKEGEDKFKNIQIDANPYSKLLASMANVAQSTLETINTILSPFAKILANNTGILTGALALIAGSLINKALPAITQWRSGLRAAADEAKDNANKIYTAYGERSVFSTEKTFKVPNLKAKVEELTKEAANAGRAAANARNKALSEGLLSSRTAANKEFTASPGSAASEKALTSLAKAAAAAAKEDNDAGLAKSKAIKEILLLQKEELKSVNLLKAAQLELRTAQDGALDSASKKMRLGSQEYQRYSIARAAARKSERLEILSNVQTASQEGGFGEGIKTLRESLTGNETLGRFAKFRTLVSGVFTAAASAVSTFVRAFGWIGLVISTAIAAFQLIKSLISNTAEESKATEIAIDALHDSVKSLSDTFDIIRKRNPLEQLSVESTIAKSNAISAFAENISKAFEKSNAEIAKMNWFDISTNFISKLWSGDVQGKFNKELASGISIAFKNLGNTEADIAAKNAIKSLLTITSESEEAVSKAINKLSDTDRAKAVELLNKTGTAAKNAANSLLGLQEAQKATGKAMKDFMNSFIPTDNMSKIGLTIQAEARELLAALNTPIASTAALLDSIKNAGNIIPPDLVKPFAEMALAISADEEKLISAREEVKRYEEQIVQLNKTISLENSKTAGTITANQERLSFQNSSKINTKGAAPSTVNAIILPEIEIAKKQLEEVLDLKNKANAAVGKYETVSKTNLNEINQTVIKSFLYGSEALASRLAAEGAKVATTWMTGLAGILGNSETSIKLRAEADKLALQGQIALINSQIALATKNEELIIVTRQLVLEQKKNRLSSVSSDDLATDGFSNLNEEIKKEEEALKRIRDLRRLSTAGKTGALEAELRKLTLASGLKTEDGIAKAQELMGAIQLSQQFNAMITQKAVLSEQIKSSELKKQIDLINKAAEDTARGYSAQLATNKAQQDALASIAAQNSEAGIQATKKINLLKMTEAEIKQLALKSEYENKLLIVKKAQEEIDKRYANKSDKKYIEFTEANSRDKNRATEDFNTKMQIARTEELNQQRAGDENIINKISANELRILEEKNDRLTFNLSLREKLLGISGKIIDSEKATGTITELNYIRTKAEYDQKTLSLNVEKEKNSIQTAHAREMNALDLRRKQLQLSLDNAPESEKGAVRNDLATQVKLIEDKNARYKESLSVLEQVAEKEFLLIEAAKQNALWTEQWRLTMEKMGSLTESLTAVFGKLGEAVGSMAQGLLEFKKHNEENLKIELALQEKIKSTKNSIQEVEDSGDPAGAKALYNQKIELEEQLTAQKRKSAQQEVSDMAKVLGSTKKLFSEKTGAYKVLNAMEKAMHVQKMAMMAEDMAKSLMATGQMISDSIARMTAGAGEAVVNQGKGEPYSAFARMAAMAAFVTSILSQFGGGAAISPPNGFSAEDRQKVQGTGQKYDSNGELVTSGLGILGDPTKKLDTLNTTIALLEKHAVGSLVYYDNMLESLRAIKDNTKSFVAALIKTGFADKPENTSSGNWLMGKNTSETLDRIISFTGTIQDAIDGNVGITRTTNTKVTEGGGLSNFFDGDTRYSSDVENLKTEDSKTYKLIAPVIEDLFTNFSNAFESAADILGIDLNETAARVLSRTVKLAPSVLATAFKDSDNVYNDVIPIITDVFNDAGNVVPSSWKDMLDLPDDFMVSIMGMTAEDALSAIESVTGLAFSDIALKLMPQFQKFQAAGESFGETVLRLASDSQTLNEAFKGIGVTLADIAPEILQLPDNLEAQNNLRIAQTRRNAAIRALELARTAAAETPVDENAGFAVGDAVNRSVIDAQNALNAATAEFSAATNSYNALVGEASTRQVEFEQAVIKANGGLETLTSRLADFSSTMLTAGQRTVVTEQMYVRVIDNIDAAAGNKQLSGVLSTIRTREDFVSKYTELASREDQSSIDLAASMLKIFPIFDKIITATDKYKEKFSGLEARMGELSIGGLSPDAAKAKTRADTLKTYTQDYKADEAAELTTRQQAIWAAEDALDLRKRETTVLTTQGRTYEALVRSREDELKPLTEAQRLIEIRRYAIEDENKSIAINNELLSAQGKTHEVLMLTREKELLGLSYEDKLRKIAVYTEQDRQKTLDLTIEKLNAEGRAYEATAISREKELIGLSDKDKLIKQATFAEQDRQKTQDLTIEKLNAEGRSYEATQLSREKELVGLSETDKAIKKTTFALQDANVEFNLTNEVLTTQGRTYEALQRTRVEEVKGLSQTQRALKSLNYAFEDLNKTQSLQIRILKASGREIEATNMERDTELLAYSAADGTLLKLAWAYEDQAAILDKLVDSLDKTTESLKNQLKILKDYKNSLILGDLSTMTTADKLVETKNQIYDQLAIIAKPAVTDAEKTAQADATSKLTGLSDQYLGFARTLYSSSSEYSNQFNWIMETIDSAIGSLEPQLSTAEKTLNTLKTSEEYLKSIRDSTVSSDELLKQYLAAGKVIDEAKTKITTPGTAADTAMITAFRNSMADPLQQFVINDFFTKMGSAITTIPAANVIEMITAYMHNYNAAPYGAVDLTRNAMLSPVAQPDNSFTTEAQGTMYRLPDTTAERVESLSPVSQATDSIIISSPGVSDPNIRAATDFARNETSPDFMGPVLPPPNIMQASRDDLLRVEVNQNIKAILDEMRTLNTEMRNMHTTVGTTTVDNTIAVERSAELVQLAVADAANNNISRLTVQNQVALR